MIEKARTYLSFVRFSHSVFALPFALTGALLASREHPVTWRHIVWIVVCMVTARSAAMGFNRLVDARFDAANPRTASREIPSGRMSIAEATAFVLFMSAAFVAAAGQLSRLCLFLSPVALVLIFWYSLAKRYTWATQLFLGLAMAIAPVGGWLAAGGGAGWEPWLLGLAIGLWVGGFDVLYACQDLDVDRRQHLRSIPVRFGIARSLWISRVMHVATIVCLDAAWAVIVRSRRRVFPRCRGRRRTSCLRAIARQRERPVERQARLRFERIRRHSLFRDHRDFRVCRPLTNP